MATALGIDYPLLIGAVGRCPLEDSGGPLGYRDMPDTRDTTQPRHTEVMELPGPEFDPTTCDIWQAGHAAVAGLPSSKRSNDAGCSWCRFLGELATALEL